MKQILVKFRKYKSWLICMTSLLLLTSCSHKQEGSDTEQTGQVVEIPVIFTVDPATNQKNNEELVESFNEAYAGQYHLKVEWMLDTADEYRSRMKRLNITDELPAIITDISFSPSFYQLMVEDHRLVDLAPYIKEDSEWLNAIEYQVLEACSEKDGSIYLSPLGTDIYSSAGIYWNKELFYQAGITEFPKTWDEFWEGCETLSDHGIVPLSLHTRGTAWAPMLLATASLGETQEGVRFMKQKLPETYKNESGKKLVRVLKKSFEYTTRDAIDRDFDVAFENFFAEQTAMIPNGYWMLEQFDEEWAKKVEFSPFPGNVLVASPEMSGWAVSKSCDEAVQKGAIEFLKFRTLKNLEQREAFLDIENRECSLLERSYASAVKEEHVIIPNYQTQWNIILQGEVLDERLPQLITRMISEEQMIAYMNESILLFKQEQ